jgi:PKD repeat protein
MQGLVSRKSCTVAIVILFVGVSFVPSINGFDLPTIRSYNLSVSSVSDDNNFNDDIESGEVSSLESSENIPSVILLYSLWPMFRHSSFNQWISNLPKPIFGSAVKCNGDNADGASVVVRAEGFSNKTTTVSDSIWQVDASGWPDGTPFNVTITLDDEWGGSKSDIVQSLYTDVGEIVLYAITIVADASFYDDCYSVGDYVQFYGNVYGGNPLYNWYWDFDDNLSSTFQNPKHSYEKIGLYNVTLKVDDVYGETDTDTVQIYIYPFIVEADYEKGDYNTGDSVQFTGSVDGGKPPYQWDWDFGDGNQSNVQSPIHSFRDIGEYEVCLTVTDADNDVNFDITSIIIHPVFKFTTRGVLHQIKFYWDGFDVFPLGCTHINIDWPGLTIAPLFFSYHNYSPYEKVATHTAVNHNMDVIFTNNYYKEVTVIAFPFIGIFGFGGVSTFCGKAIVYGS